MFTLLSVLFAAAVSLNAQSISGGQVEPPGNSGVVPVQGGGAVDQIQGTILQTRGDISEPMRHDAIEFSKATLVLHGDANLPMFATHVKDLYDAKYGGSWNVFVATGRMSFKTMFGTYVILTVNTDTVFIGK